MTMPTNVRCDLYSGKNGAFGALVAPPDLTLKKRCYYCDLYSGKYGTHEKFPLYGMY